MIKFIMSAKRLLLLLLPAVTIFLLLLILTFRDRTPVYSAKMQRSVIKDVTVYHFRGESLQWRARIDEAILAENGRDAYLRKISLFYPEKKLTLLSEDGYYNMKDGDIRLSRHVRGKTEDFVFMSPELLYMPSKRIITASKGLEVKGKNFTIEGDHGRIIKSRTLEVEGNVKATFY